MFDKLKNLINKTPEAPGDTFLKNVEKAYKKEKRTLDAKAARQRKIEDCAAVLRDCRFTFNKTINVENSLAAEMRRKGYPTTKQHARVKDAAVGILIVDQALYELKSINTESDLNSALNKMGMALRQLRRIDNSSTAVSGSTEKIIRQWYPTGLSSEEIAKDLEDPSLPEVPMDISSIVDESFVQNMMLGDSFELCMLKRQEAPKVDPTRDDRARLMDDIRSAVGNSAPEKVDTAAINEMYSKKF